MTSGFPIWNQVPVEYWSILAALILAGVLYASRSLLRSVEFDSFDVKTGVKIIFKPIVKILGYGFRTSASREVNGRGVVVWSYINLVVLVTLIWHATQILALWVAIGMAALNCLCFVSALLVIDEESDVWNGLLAPAQATFRSTKFIKSSLGLTTSGIFALVFAALVAQLWDAVSPRFFISMLPKPLCDTRYCEFMQYLVATIYEVPAVGWLLKKVVPGGAATFSDEGGRYFQLVIYFSVVTLIFGVFKVLFVQRKEINDLVLAFGHARDTETLKYLTLRAQRAPESIMEKVTEKALRHPSDLTRRRFTDAAIRAQLPAFTTIYLQNFQRESNNDNKRMALESLRKMLEESAEKIADVELLKNLSELKVQTEEYKHYTRVRRGLDELIILHVDLLRRRNCRIPSDKFPERLLHVAITGEDNVRERAFSLASSSKPIDLCRTAIEHLTIEALADEEKRAILAESLTRVANIIENRFAGWKRSPQRMLLRSLKARKRALEKQRDELGNAELPGSLRTLEPEELSGLCQSLKENITWLEGTINIMTPTAERPTNYSEHSEVQQVA